MPHAPPAPLPHRVERRAVEGQQGRFAVVARLVAAPKLETAETHAEKIQLLQAEPHQNQ